MSKTAVIYYSKYGTTENYARLIAKALGADLFEAKKTKFRDIKGYDTVVFGGGIYSGGIRGIELITKNWYKGLCEKKVVCFAVGITIDKEENREQCMDINFRKRFVIDAEEDHGRDDLSASELIKEKRLPIKCFFLPGALTLIGSFFSSTFISPDHPFFDSPGGQQLLDYFNKSCDLVDYDSIKPVVEACL